ncbi:MAG: NapC/NirT family cytochrome c [Verrucomicrobia bacterium]|nr:NapC/NirT family cytochrome c [Verrucomicrobiota bacterium]
MSEETTPATPATPAAPAAPAAGSSTRLSRLRNWLSLSGMVLALAAFFAFLMLFGMDFFAAHANPYMGILAYVVAPMFLIAGLLITLVGYILENRRVRKGLADDDSHLILHVNLARKRDRRLLVGFVGGSLGFLFLTALGSYQTYHMTETNSFCGKTCHTSMDPQFRAYEHSAHARVACVSCHVGPGAAAYIRTKISGVRQLYHTVAGDFNRPIRLHNVNQRPAQETCQSCHWSQKHTGDLQKTYKHFLADETNTPFTVAMILKVGGSDPIRGPVAGIHSHMNVANTIEFIALDDDRLNIPWVRVTDINNKVTEYRTAEFKDDPAKHPIRRMDCMDCHNRPSHKFMTPNAAVDQSMAFGRIDPGIPWAKAKVVKALTGKIGAEGGPTVTYRTREDAESKIEQYLRQEFPDNEPRIDALIAEAKAIYKINFFPEMKADWRVHPDHIGHKDTPGCFRCHDGKHLASDGKSSIKGSDCNACHLIVAQGAGKDLEKINPQGTAFFHIDSENSDPTCAECHNGQTQE